MDRTYSFNGATREMYRVYYRLDEVDVATIVIEDDDDDEVVEKSHGHYS